MLFRSDTGSVEMKKITQNERPKDSLVSPTPVIGKVLRIPVLKGQVLTKEHFATSGTGVHLAATLPEGYRAVTIALDQSGSLEGLLYPGGVVDVMATFRLTEGAVRGESLSTTLLERIPVLAIEDRTVVGAEAETGKSTSARSGRRLVTLRVTPQQAAQLQLASEHGSISLAMRNPLDRAVPEQIRVLLSTLSYDEPHWIHDPPEPVDTVQLVPPTPTTPDPPEHVAETPQPVEGEPKTPTWQVVIIRGNAQETQALPLKIDTPDHLNLNQ